jgi:hypothetical protein
MVYNLTVYEIQGGAQLYTVINSISNAESLGVGSDAASSLLASSNVTFSVTPEKIGGSQGGGVTLYILNCSDSYGWWITGYTAQSLAQDLYNLLSPYFTKTIMVQNTTQLGQILNGTALQGETLQNAVVINTCGEAVPIPTYYAIQNSSDYARYCHFLGQKVRVYNWTWASIVGYPLYYVSNTGYFTGSSDHNSWGIYGMKLVGQPGVNAFLQGLDNKPYQNDGAKTAYDVGQVHLTQNVAYYCNYYGIYPSPYQTSTRAFTEAILNNYNLTIGLSMFDKKSGCYPGAVYRHVFSGETNITGSLLAIGLARTADIRLTALGLLSYYQPRLFRSEYTASGTSRLVVLQLGLVGGV